MEYYNSTVLGGSVTGAGQGGAIQPDSAYKSLGSVYNGLSSVDNNKGNKTSNKMTVSQGYSLKTRSVQNMAERSYKIHESVLATRWKTARHNEESIARKIMNMITNLNET